MPITSLRHLDGPTAAGAPTSTLRAVLSDVRQRMHAQRQAKDGQATDVIPSDLASSERPLPTLVAREPTVDPIPASTDR
jgi:hypothetical protein